MTGLHAGRKQGDSVPTNLVANQVGEDEGAEVGVVSENAVIGIRSAHMVPQQENPLRQVSKRISPRDVLFAAMKVKRSCDQDPEIKSEVPEELSDAIRLTLRQLQDPNAVLQSWPLSHPDYLPLMYKLRDVLAGEDRELVANSLARWCKNGSYQHRPLLFPFADSFGDLFESGNSDVAAGDEAMKGNLAVSKGQVPNRYGTFRPKADMLKLLGEELDLTVPCDSLSFSVIHREPGWSMIYADRSLVLSGRALALVRTDSLPARLAEEA